MGIWDKNSKTHVSTMNEGDFLTMSDLHFLKMIKK